LAWWCNPGKDDFVSIDRNHGAAVVGVLTAAPIPNDQTGFRYCFPQPSRQIGPHSVESGHFHLSD
jgi:hypothetical protein